MKYLYRTRVGSGLDYDCLADAEITLEKGDRVVIKCERYQDVGTVEKCFTEEPADEGAIQKKRDSGGKGRHIEGQKTPEIMRKATESDLAKEQENRERCRTMQGEAGERVEAHGLEMKIIDTHYSLDRRLVVFQFTAEGRVDFRQLLRDLSHKFRTRVELRQIGVRDEAAIQGGIGPCGRAFCCATFLRRFSSINVKMAKVQGLSLNPVNISGACGRLKCCLQYEFDLYRERLREEKRASSAARPEPDEEPLENEPAEAADSRTQGASRNAVSPPKVPAGGAGQAGDQSDNGAELRGDDQDESSKKRRRRGRRNRTANDSPRD